MKASRLLQRLDAAVAAAPSALRADCLRAERAVYLFRLGRNDEAQAALAALHRQHDRRPQAEISIWLNLAEGLAIYFADMGSGAYDKVHRAHALSGAMRLDGLHALAAAWLAQLDYMRHDVEAMARHLRESLRLADSDAHATRSRACLVAVQALHHAGRTDLAAVWNQRAREHAFEDGDDATVSALMHNMAWLRMVAWRQALLTGTSTPSAGRQALADAESTARYDALVGVSSLFVLHPVLQAQVASLQGNAKRALKFYEHERVTAQADTTTRLHGNLLADQAWCYLQVGNSDAARSFAARSESSLAPGTHIDDRAATHSRLAQIHAALGARAEADRHGELAARAWAANDVLQARVVELIGGLTTQG